MHAHSVGVRAEASEDIILKLSLRAAREDRGSKVDAFTVSLLT